MAWNPNHEVAVARDAARALGDAPICVLLYLKSDGKQLGLATFGKTVPLCKFAADLGDHLFEAAMKYGDAPS